MQALERNRDIRQEGSVSMYDRCDILPPSFERSVLKCCTLLGEDWEECVLQKRWRSLHIYIYAHTYICMYIYIYIWNICFFPIYLWKRREAQCSKDIFFLVMLVKRENVKTEVQYVLKTSREMEQP